MYQWDSLKKQKYWKWKGMIISLIFRYKLDYQMNYAERKNLFRRQSMIASSTLINVQVWAKG